VLRLEGRLHVRGPAARFAAFRRLRLPRPGSRLDRLLIDLGIPSGWVQSLQLDLLARLLLAAVLGGVVGVERELSGKPAGLRTNLLICVGSALFTSLSIGVASLSDASGFRSDPGRIAAQIVTGIGFLGAGTILHSRGKITGLTTAATVWVVAAIGMAVGAGAYVAAVGTTALVMFSLALLVRMESFTTGHRRVGRRYTFETDPDVALLRLVEDSFRGAGMRVRLEAMEKGRNSYETTIYVSGPVPRHERVTDALLAHPGIRRLSRQG